LYSLLYIIKVIISKQMRWAGHVAHREMNACCILVGKPEEKKPLGRPRCRGEGNIGMYHRETGEEDVYWIHLAKDKDQWQAVVNMVTNLQFP